jgi:OPT family oligopeptide transporter
MRRFLVWPSSLLWPENLTDIILIRTLNDRLVDGSSLASKREISRLNFFLFAMVCQCVYFWLPNHIMPILESFAWLCWINPNNLILSQLTGTEGFGIGSLNFNWLSMNALWNSPIIVPLWAKINILIGFVSIVWILSPLCFYTNFLELHFSPIRTLQIRRSKGYIDHLKNYIDSSTYFFNETKYKLYTEEVGDERLSVVLVLQLGFGLLLITAVVVHTILYHGHDILKHARTSVSNRNNDIHCFLMSQYSETPEWWFITIFILSLINTILVCLHSDLMEWYYVLLSIVVGWAFILPFGIIRANTGLIVIRDIIPLYIGSLILHNKPMSVLIFRLAVVYLQTDALTLISNLKLCHYAKIPPRSLFMMLVVGRFVAAVVGCVVGNHLLTNIKEICHSNNTNWNCPMLHETMQIAVMSASTGERFLWKLFYLNYFCYFRT